jgi:hypothetical protein
MYFEGNQEVSIRILSRLTHRRAATILENVTIFCARKLLSHTFIFGGKRLKYLVMTCRLTHDQKYRDWAWEAVEAIEKHCKYNESVLLLFTIKVR